MAKGRVTIPTNKGFEKETKEIMQRWGADAIRDCDGTKLPDNISEFGAKVYSTYFVDRGDHEWAANNPDEWQHLFLMTPHKMATENSLEINLMEHFYDDQVKPDFNADSVECWEAIDRTTGKVHSEWEVDENNCLVILKNTIPFHEYTFSFLADRYIH